MSSGRLQQIVPPGIILAVGLWVAWISFSATPEAAFLFPRIVSTVFVALAAWVFARAILNLELARIEIPVAELRKMAPGLVVGFLYVYLAAANAGFYTATAVAVFLLILLYDPAPHGLLASWIKRISVTGGFLGVLYLLFAVTLNVYTPREVLFG